MKLPEYPFAARENGKILDHPPYPGPIYWDHLCLLCSSPVDEHGGVLERLAWRRRMRGKQHLMRRLRSGTIALIRVRRK